MFTHEDMSLIVAELDRVLPEVSVVVEDLLDPARRSAYEAVCHTLDAVDACNAVGVEPRDAIAHAFAVTTRGRRIAAALNQQAQV